jgi:hypothetical protein
MLCYVISFRAIMFFPAGLSFAGKDASRLCLQGINAPDCVGTLAHGKVKTIKNSLNIPAIKKVKLIKNSLSTQ